MRKRTQQSVSKVMAFIFYDEHLSISVQTFSDCFEKGKTFNSDYWISGPFEGNIAKFKDHFNQSFAIDGTYLMLDIKIEFLKRRICYLK